MDPDDGSKRVQREREPSSPLPSPTDTTSNARLREELSESFQSTDTVRHRPSEGYGTLPPPTPSAHDRSHGKSFNQPQSSPVLVPLRLTGRSTTKPPMIRRASSQAPHRGGIFSTYDDPREVEADTMGRTVRAHRRRGTGTLSRLQSHHDPDAESSDARHGDGNDDASAPNADVGGPPDQDDPVRVEDEAEGLEAHSDDDNDDDDDDGVSEAESFTLKDRQLAINATHPFGIRLWKPALYKKDRSVQKTAEGDIHSSPGGHVSNWLIFFNLLWTLLFGWWMALLAAVSALFCFISVAPSGREYGRVLWGLSGYLFYPFGKFVRLEQDDNYLHEDEGEGRSISEYEQWQQGDIEHGRLFFGPAEPLSNRSIIGRSRLSIDSVPSETDSLLHGRRGGSDLGGSGGGGGDSPNGRRMKRRLFGRGQWNIGRITFFIFFYGLVSPSLILVSFVCWLLVFCIPMGKVTMLLFDHLRRHPLALSFESDVVAARVSDAPHSSILLCTYRGVGLKYWKYTIDGTNIFLINLMAVVFFVIFDYLVLFHLLHIETAITSPAFLFMTGLLSIIPLAYFIGQAVASISAQSSMGVGAAINALFSTVVEVYLYCIALSQGKAQLVEGSIVGSIFAGILFLPGLSMCFGAIKRKTQRFNARSAGVTSTMLLFAVIAAFSPTLFWQIYGSHELSCQDCTGGEGDGVQDCKRCYYSEVPPLDDPFYLSAVRPLCYMNAAFLFLSYVVGLWFTLRTHAAVIWNTDDGLVTGIQAQRQSQPWALPETPGPLATPGPLPSEAAHGHDAPNWSRPKSAAILLGATILYAIIAEILVDTVDVVLEGFAIDEKFLGITLFALVPNTTEFLNAISFAMNGNIALSMEIGSAYALQVCLLQIPALVLFSAVSPSSQDSEGSSLVSHTFSLLFPQWDMVMTILCVFLLSYMYGEGKSNYFKGSILLLSYLVVVAGFYFSGLSG